MPGKLLSPKTDKILDFDDHDWAIPKILDKRSWPIEKYAAIPAVASEPGPCVFIGVNQLYEGNAETAAKCRSSPALAKQYRNCILRLKPGQISTTSGHLELTSTITMLWHDMSTSPGSSGSPIYVICKKKFLTLVGLHSGPITDGILCSHNQVLSLQAPYLCNTVAKVLRDAGAPRALVNRWKSLQGAV